MMGNTQPETKKLIALLLAMAALLLGTAGFAATQTAKLRAARVRLDAVTQKALYETCELTEGLAVNLRKLQVAGEPGQAQALLSEAALQSQGALGNLALLPVGEDTVAATMKFINQAGDFATALSRRLGSGGTMTDADYAALDDLAESAAAFSSSMDGLMGRYERGEAVFDGAGAGTGGEALYPIANPAAEYPTLLYDGPFSDGRQDGDFRTLSGLQQVDEPTARAALAAWLGDVAPEDIRFAGESAIPVPCWEYSLNRGGYCLTVGVTRSGARVLYMLCEDDIEAGTLSREEAVAAAREFLERRGYGPLVTSYASAFGGILTVNFAATQDGVVLYPDLVKAQVSLRDGAVVGLEAAGYLMNHVPRDLPGPALTEGEALERLGPELRAERARLCVIPQGSGEALCYEITAQAGGDTFLCYIDALTGAERELMQVVDAAGGEMVM